MDIRKLIRVTMKEKGITQDTLASNLGISQSIITRFLSGTSISDTLLQRICDELKVRYQSLEDEKLDNEVARLNVKYAKLLKSEGCTIKIIEDI
jgi:transcriptional regulator with XRE-family HTH domain